jgi:HSP20 family protein
MERGMTRWSPLSDLSDFRGRLEQLFDEGGIGGGRTLTPRLDVIEGDGELVLKVDLPGIKADDVELEVENDVLRVSGSHTEEKEEKDERYLRRERRTGSFPRSLALPKGVDPEAIEASSEDGLLEVHVPLPEREREPARVEVKAKGG